MVMATLNAAHGKSRAEYAEEIKAELSALVHTAKRLLERGFQDHCIDGVSMSQFVPVVERHVGKMRNNSLAAYHKALGMSFMLGSMCRNSVSQTLSTDEHCIECSLEFVRYE